MITTTISIFQNTTKDEIQRSIDHLMILLPHAPDAPDWTGELDTRQEKLQLEVPPAEATGVCTPTNVAISDNPGVAETAAASKIFAGTVGAGNTVVPPPPPNPVPPPPGPSAELDKDGAPWDERIHSSTRVKNKDGTWRTKRGVTPEAIAAVNAERAHVGVPAAPGQVPAPPPVDNEAPGIAFIDVVRKVQGAINSGAKDSQGRVITQPIVSEVAKLLGLADFASLAKRPDLFNTFLASLGI